MRAGVGGRAPGGARRPGSPPPSPTPLRRRYERLKRDFNERVDQKAGYYRRYARQVSVDHDDADALTF
jgi:hypothetical protein